MVKISIIVPTYNGEQYILKCINSLLDQTLKEIEIIVIDDGSTDNTKNLVLQIKDPRVKYYYQKNQMQGAARNYGIKLAKGDYIAFVDDDDYVDSKMYEKMYNKAISFDSDLVVCDMERFEIDGKNKTIIKGINYYTSDIVKNYIVSSNGPTNKIIKKDILLKNDLYFLERHIYEDLAVVPIYAIYAENIAYMKYAPYKYVRRKHSTMNQEKYTKRLKDIFYAYDFLFDKYKKSKENYDEEFEFIFIYHIFLSASLRILPFKTKEAREDLLKINKMLKEKCPNWRKNKYYKKKNLKFKIACNLLYYKKYKTVKLLTRFI